MSAAPTWAEVWLQIRYRLIQFELLDDAMHTNSPNWLGQEDTLAQALEGQYVDRALASVANDRSRLSALLAPTNIASALEPFIRDLGAVINATERTIPGILARIREYMAGVGRASGTITAATAANPVEITSNSHGLSNGDLVYIENVGGMVEINDRFFTVANASTNTFELSGENGSGHTTYTSGGTWTQRDAVATSTWTFGTPANVSGNTGNGAIYRTTVDELGLELNATHAEARRAEVVADQSSVDRHEEVLLFRGATAEKDFLEVTGSGAAKALRIPAVARRTYDRWLQNSTFNTLQADTQPSTGSPVTPGSTTAITGWTLDATTGVTVGIDTPSVYRTHIGETAPKWVRFATNRTITQVFGDTTRAQFVRGVPYWCAVVVERASSCDGSLVQTLGGVSRTIAMSSLTNDTPTVVPLVASAADADRYYRQFKAEALSFQAQLTGQSTGSVYIHEVQFAPMVAWDGQWVIPVGGSTPWLLGDELTWTDSFSSRKLFTYWFWRAALGHLATSTAALETIAES